MHVIESIRGSFQNIFAHKLRSFLTLLGIIIGVFAVVTMFSTIYGLKDLINSRMKDMGWNNSLIIYPSTGEKHGSSHIRHRFRRLRREAKPLSYTDYNFLKKNIKSKYIYGYIDSYQKYYFQENEKYVRLTATNTPFFTCKTYDLMDGRYFNSFEESNAIKVCVLGYHFFKEHYPDENPIGKELTLGQNRFKIIGILGDDKLNKKGMNFNPWERKRDLEAIYIPLSTGSKYLRANNALDYIYLQAENEDDYNSMKVLTTQKLLSLHSMTHDFRYNDVGAFLLKITKEINQMIKKWNITLSAIASISLIVGGIGLFSTLLISINERMKEIGIRKSIGATNLDIFLHFLLEAVILSLLGAFWGIFFSFLLVKGISTAMEFSFPIPLEGIFLGIVFSVFIGLLSGLYPAIKASKIDTIKAIYYFE